MQHLESEEQIALIQWSLYARIQYPELDLLFHIPNGGKRNVAEAVRFQRMGVKPGVPDLFLPVPRGQYHGLFIEMKAQGGRPSGHQKDWITDLRKQGYKVSLCYGWDEARQTITQYLELRGNEDNE